MELILHGSATGVEGVEVASRSGEEEDSEANDIACPNVVYVPMLSTRD